MHSFCSLGIDCSIIIWSDSRCAPRASLFGFIVAHFAILGSDFLVFWGLYFWLVSCCFVFYGRLDDYKRPIIITIYLKNDHHISMRTNEAHLISLKE